jgi:membrane protease YdiL (CAAX protease family)
MKTHTEVEATPVRTIAPLTKTIQFMVGFLILFLIYRTILLLSTSLDWTVTMLMVCLVMVMGSILTRKWIAKETWKQAVQQVGLGIPRWGAVLISLLVSVSLLFFFPIYSSQIHTSLPLNPRWPWMLLGVITGVGITEEILFRGFAFHFLNERWNFWKAATISMVLFALMHLLLLFWLPLVVAIAAIILSIIASFPMAYLFNKGNQTIWAGAILHSAALATSLFVIPEAVSVSLSLVWIIAILAAMLLVVLLARLFLRDPKYP